MSKDDREMHTKAAEQAARTAEERLRREAEAQHEAAKNTPANGVRARIEIEMLEDGTFRMNGPWHDRILFEGVMQIGIDAMRANFARMVAEMQRQNQPRIQQIAVPPGMDKKLRTHGV